MLLCNDIHNCQISKISRIKHIQKAIIVNLLESSRGNLLNENAVNKIWQCSVFKNYLTYSRSNQFELLNWLQAIRGHQVQFFQEASRYTGIIQSNWLRKKEKLFYDTLQCRNKKNYNFCVNRVVYNSDSVCYNVSPSENR